MSRYLHYACSLLLSGRDHFFIWRSNDVDTLVVSGDDGRVEFFRSEIDLKSAVLARGWGLEDSETTTYDLDSLATWVANPCPAFDCETFLNVWNMLTDLRRTKGLETRLASDAFAVYDKVFRGCNLPAMKAPHYHPQWTEQELAALCRALDEGIALFANEISPR